MIERANFAGEETPRWADLEYRNCNFTQEGVPDGLGRWMGRRIFPGDDTPRTFIECNMVNVIPPPGSTLIRCNTAIVEYNRAGADHIHGRLNPGSFDREMRPSAEGIAHKVRSEYVTVKVDPSDKDGLVTAMAARPDVRQVVD